MNDSLLKKYDMPGPRYTSYPTVPYWDVKSFHSSDWVGSVQNNFWVNAKELSLYIHLPFCESLCTYCGCNTRITKNHNVELKYIDALLKEWRMYLEAFPSRPVIKELHLGGGTPTFFSPKNLKYLVTGILSGAELSSVQDFAFEGHPANTTKAHLQALYEVGFRRVSFGIQDFNSTVQKLIHRIQTFDQVKHVTKTAREIGYTSVNFDLIYGLPGQTIESVEDTIKKTVELKPDRIAFYSYAHVPHLKPAQKSLESNLPNQPTKRKLYELGKEMLTENGYTDIGMDHFALDGDALNTAYKEGRMHRNFMGYSTQRTNMVIGLGVSAISDTWTSFAQNVKTVEEYYELLSNDELPIMKGHHLTTQDVTVRRKILDLICKYETNWSDQELLSFGMDINFSILDELKGDGLISIYEHGMRVEEKGKPFIRNICMALDVRMWKDEKTDVFFSRTV